MNKIKLATLGIAFCIGATVFAGCERDDEGDYNSYTPAYGVNQSSQNNASDSDGMDNANGMSDSEMNATSRIDPHKASALEATVQFEQGSTNLNDDAKENLENLVDGLKDGKNNYLTIRLPDDNAPDDAAADDTLKQLGESRVNELKAYLNNQGVYFAGVAVDNGGNVSNYSEGNAMSKPDVTDQQNNARYAIITIENENDSI